MDIKSKDAELFYLGCVISEAIERLENIIKKGIVSKENILYDSCFRSLLLLKERWVTTVKK